MKIGGLVWFIAGFAFCLLYLDDGIGSVLSGTVTVIGAVVSFMLELGVIGGVGGVLLLIGLSFLVGREWTERARGRVDADDAWKKRRAYRTPKREKS